MGDRQQEEESLQQIRQQQGGTNAETSLNETNTGSTVRTLPRRSERRRPPGRYAITISHQGERDVVTACEYHYYCLLFGTHKRF